MDAKDRLDAMPTPEEWVWARPEEIDWEALAPAATVWLRAPWRSQARACGWMTLAGSLLAAWGAAAGASWLLGPGIFLVCAALGVWTAVHGFGRSARAGAWLELDAAAERWRELAAAESKDPSDHLAGKRAEWRVVGAVQAGPGERAAPAPDMVSLALRASREIRARAIEPADVLRQCPRARLSFALCKPWARALGGACALALAAGSRAGAAELGRELFPASAARAQARVIGEACPALAPSARRAARL